MNLLLGLPLGIFRLLGGLLMFLLRLLPLVLVVGLLLFLYRRKHGGGKGPRPEKPDQESGPNFSGPVYTVDYQEVREEDRPPEPEPPRAFDHKPGWLVVRSQDPEAVLTALGLTDRKPASWTSGLAAVSPGKSFATPSLNGWVVLVCAGDRLISKEGLEELSRQFSEVQAFVTRRDRELYGWVRYRSGACDRGYGVSEGRVFLDQGELTPEEIALGFGRFPRMSGGSREGFLPDEEDVLSIARAWGLDPLLEGTSYPPSTGWLCNMDN